MALLGKVPAAKLNNLVLSLGRMSRWKRRTDSVELSFDLHTGAGVHMK